MPAGIRDWAELLPELLGSISERLPWIDYLRFSAVCSAWAAAAADSSHDSPNRPLGMPFVLHLGVDGESCILVNIHDRRSICISPLPEMRDKWVAGSQDGWLAILDKYSQVSLLNPITHVRIYLPSVATIPGVDPVYNPDGSIKEFIDNILDNGLCTLHEFRLMSFKKIVLSSRPTADSYTAVAIFSDGDEAIIATAASGKWTPLRKSMVTDIIYHDGKFLLLSDHGNLWELDTTVPHPQMRMVAPGPDIYACGIDKFLVNSSADLLQIWSVNDLYRSDKTISFKVMKFDPDRAAWVALKSLGDRSLFVGPSYSISLSVREVPLLKPNCIYFTEVLWGFIPEVFAHKPPRTRDIGVFNMDDGSVDPYCPLDPRLNWPPPLWFAPSLL